MGLDMYLSARRYTSKYSEPEINKKLREYVPEIADSGNLESIELIVEIGYWRKANAIHNWFVQNVQEGEDNCQESYVSREDLITLKSVCEECIKDPRKAPEVLPSKEGFFFGSTEYNDGYFDDLKHTIEIIDKCLALPDSYNFQYSASW